MEKLFCIYGCFALIAVIMMMNQPEKTVKCLNNNQKEPEDEEEKKEWQTRGCLAISIIGWFFCGLFTSQWFICAIYLLISVIESAIKRMIKHQRSVTEYLAGIAFDFAIVLFIIINTLWLHIDVYHLIF